MYPEPGEVTGIVATPLPDGTRNAWEIVTALPFVSMVSPPG